MTGCGSKNRKTFYREGVACCCHNAAINEEREGHQNNGDFALIHDIQDFLRDLCGFPKCPLFFHRPSRFQGFVSGQTEIG
jgi:hypothetical protein